MLSTQDSLVHQNGAFGGIRISDTIGNTGNAGANIFTGNYGLIIVHSSSTLSANTSTNILNLTGYSLTAGTYGGIHSTVQLSGGDITVYNYPKREVDSI